MVKAFRFALIIGFTVLIVISIGLLDHNHIFLSAKAVADTGGDSSVETSIVKSTMGPNLRHIDLFGLASGKLARLELALRRSDGWYWDSKTATWIPGQSWQEATLTPTGVDKFFWDETLSLPVLDSEVVYVLARAVDHQSVVDPTPAGSLIYLDNVPPVVNKFGLDGSRWLNDHQVDLVIDVTGAKYMRLAKSLKGLSGAEEVAYDAAATFQLSAGDGLKRIYGLFSDANGNTTLVQLSGGPVGLDTAPPVVDRLSPSAETKSISVGARISVRFIDSSDIESASIRNEVENINNFYLVSNGSLILTSMSYDQKSKTAYLTPTEPLVKDQTYTAVLKSGIRDVTGNEVKGERTWSFRAVEPSPPETKIDSLPGQTASKSGLAIKGVALDSNGVGGVGVFIRDGFGRYWNSGSTTWTAEPFANEAELARTGKKKTTWQWYWDLPSSDGDRFIVTAVAKDRFLAEDQTPAGVALSVDNRSPRIKQLVLQNGAQVTASDTIEVASGVEGADEMRFAESLADLKVESYQPFDANTKMRLSKKQGDKVIYGQWRDTLGNTSRPGAPGSYARIILDKAGPKVASMFPPDKEKDVNISVMITANFDEISLEESGVNTETVRLLDQKGDLVESIVTFDELSKTATLTPLESLIYGTKYQVVVAGTIKDRLGNTLGYDTKWSFKTIDVSDHPPAKPNDLAVISMHRGDQLTWTPPDRVDRGHDFKPPVQGGYNVYWSEDRSGPFILINQVPVTSLKYFYRDYDRPARRFYMVRAVDAGGSESEESNIRSNKEIDAVFNVEEGDTGTITPSNNLVGFRIRKLKRSAKLRARNIDLLNAPTTPIRLLELESSPTVRLKNLSIVIPGDPTSATLTKKTSDGWQPISGGVYSYDIAKRTVTYGPMDFQGTFAVVNKKEATPPSSSDISIGVVDGNPVVSWPPARDFDSGVSGYRLLRSETTLTVDSTESIEIDLPKKITRFIDNNAKPGHRYFYGVVAINGSGLVGPLGGIDSTLAPGPKIGHRPRMVGVTNCRSCHLEKRLAVVRTIDCRICHDGTGSRVLIANADEARGPLCRLCHALSRARLTKAGNLEGGPCSDCHEKVLTQKPDGGSGHVGDSTLNSLACASCHSLHRPGGKKVKYLVDPADTRTSWAGSTSDFCIACHKSDRWPEATETLGSFVPRTVIFPSLLSGSLFPWWDKSGWVKAGHNDVAECTTCHQPHSSPNDRLIGYKTKNDTYLDFTRMTASEDICYECHRPKGPRGAKDVMTIFQSPSGHNQGALGTHNAMEPALAFGILGRHVNCNDCHNVHEVQSSPRQKFSNRVSGALRGVAGVEPGKSGPGTVPEYSEVYPATREYQICFKCHSSYVDMPPAGMTDVAKQVNSANLSYHPVTARGKNRGLKLSAFINGWSQKATMYCSDCHTNGNKSGVAQGPHGSEYKPMLAAPYGDRAADNRQDELCYQCHNKDAYRFGKDGSRFEGGGGHSRHVDQEKLGCYKCHETHGSSYTKHLVKIVAPAEESGTIGFTHDTTGGSCISTCHLRPTEDYQYKHSY